jgi:hypothetical protein
MVMIHLKRFGYGLVAVLAILGIFVGVWVIFKSIYLLLVYLHIWSLIYNNPSTIGAGFLVILVIYHIGSDIMKEMGKEQ